MGWFKAGYHTWGNWTPGSSLHLKVYFNTTEVGVYNNSAHIYWKWKDWGPDDTHEALEVWANASIIVAEPEFTVNKVASSNIVEVGDIINYNITVTNTGLVNLTGVFVQDKNYSNGLRYLDYTDKDSWEFDGVDKWTFVGVLAPGESTSLLLSFEVTKAGLLINNVIAGNGLKNETHSSEADVEAEEPEENKTDGNPDGPEGSDEDEIPHDSENVDDDSDKSGDGSEEADNVSGETQDGNEVQAETSKSVMNATGNPLFVLLLCLIALGLVPSRGKK
ncbi:hypothetical protein [Methanobrevibacter sp.]|uniref:DUF7507 domain-containing protein n=1 Tax=Methanobrevibacter sp. TaxID=66852 RepID=UPI003868F6A9